MTKKDLLELYKEHLETLTRFQKLIEHHKGKQSFDAAIIKIKKEITLISLLWSGAISFLIPNITY